MPTYEYRRPDGTTFEIVQKFTDATLTVDPETGVPVQKVLHAPAIHFKGKGFHNTDYGTRNRNRELETSAAEGADKHDAKMADKAAEKKKTEASRGTAGSDSGSSSSSGGDNSSSSSSSSSSDKDKGKSSGADKASKPKAA